MIAMLDSIIEPLYFGLLRRPFRAIVRRLLPSNGRVLLGRLRGMSVANSDLATRLGVYERHLQSVIWNALAPGDVVYDIGANIGIFTLLASRRVGSSGHVYPFEPLPDNLIRLRTVIAVNHLENVTIAPYAVSADVGETEF